MTLAEVTQLIAWTRRLSDAGADPDPAELAAFLLAKRDLLTRIQHQHPGQPQEQPRD